MTTTRMTFEVRYGDVDSAWRAVDNATSALNACGLSDAGALVVETDDGTGVAGEMEINQWGANATRRAFKALLDAQAPKVGCVQVTGEVAGTAFVVR